MVEQGHTTAVWTQAAAVRLRDSRRRMSTGLLAVLLLVSSALAVWHCYQNRHSWTPDAEIYLSMTLQDGGATFGTALDTSRRFMRDEVRRGNPFKGEGLYTDDPPRWWVDQFALFRNRPMYPLICSLLYPVLGPVALRVVSAVAYVLTVVAMFALLCLVTAPIIAGIGALVFGTEALVLYAGSMPMTDGLALLFWTCTLGSVVAFQRRPASSWLVIIGLASIALALTRPAFLLPVGAALGAFGAMRRSSRGITAAAPLLATMPAIAIFALYSAAVHGPGVLSQLQWQFASQSAMHGFGTGHGPMGWYLSAVLRGAKNVIKLGVPGLGGTTLLLLALLGCICSWRKCPPVRIAVASALAIFPALFVNPVDVDRPLLLPMAPVILIPAVALVQQALHGDLVCFDIGLTSKEHDDSGFVNGLRSKSVRKR